MRASRALWLLFSLFIVYGATIPFNFAGFDGIWERAAAVSPNPLIGADTGRRVSIPDAIQNVLLFVPFGILGVAAGARARPWRRMAWVAFLGGLLSSGVEVLQLLTIDRVSATSDILMNTMGTLLGAAAAMLAVDLYQRVLDRLRWAGLADLAELRPLLIAAGVIIVAFLQPFDFTLDVSGLATKVRVLEHDLWQRTVPRDEGIVLLLTSLLSMSLASYAAALGEPSPALKAWLLSSALVVPLEAAQIVVGSRQPGLWDAVVAVAGAGLGAGLWAASLRIQWPAFWRTILACMTALAVGLQMLSPFEWTDAHSGFSVFPFYGYYTRTTFEGLSSAIELGLGYFPLGFCLVYGAARPGRATAVALSLTLAIALAVEYCQGWVVGRYADLTAVILGLGGACAGAWLGRRTET